MKIYLSYSINRKPIACLLHDIMTDVGPNAALHSNQINAFHLYDTATVILALNVCLVPCAAASGCAHLYLFIVYLLIRPFVPQMICQFKWSGLFECV